MTRTQRILSSTGISYLNQAAIMALGLWLTPFLLQRVGQRSLGLWLVINQTLGYLTLLDFGVIAMLPREVAVASGLPEPARQERLASLIYRVRAIVRWQTLALGGISVAIWWWMPAGWSELRWPLAVVLLAFVACYPLRVPNAVLQGLQDLPFLAKTQFIGWAAGSVTTIVLVARGNGLLGLVAGWTVTLALPAVAAWWRLRTAYRPMKAPSDNGSAAPYLQKSAWVSVSQIAQVFLSGSDVMLLARLLGPAAVVPYSCTGKLVTVFANHPQLLMHAAQPALSELRASESKARLASVATALSQAMLIMSGALLVVILPVNEFFVSSWVGPSQYSGLALTFALVTMMLMRHWNVATIYTLFCFGYERQLSLTSLADGVLSIVLTAALVSKWGAIGAPIASIVSVLLISLPMNTRSVAREMGMRSFAFLMRLLPLLASITLVAGTAGLLAVRYPAVTLVAVVERTVPLVLGYAALVAPLAWFGPLRPYIRMLLRLRSETRRATAGPASDGVATSQVNVGVR
ncbi:MAG: oligosaccharide flippase family protein [Vicinamibacterales bacterium]